LADDVVKIVNNKQKPVIKQMKRYVDQDCLRSLVHAFITSRLDYCNCLFAQCNVSYRQRLQRVQNRAAHLVLNAPPRTPSLPLLQQLHWLPVEARITYKLCLLMYRVVHRKAPVYRAELCQPQTHPQTNKPTDRTDYNTLRHSYLARSVKIGQHDCG